MDYKTTFGVPPEHTLTDGEFHSHRGGQTEYWDYEEQDASGQTIARYRRYENTDIYGKPEEAWWEKRDLAGNVIESGK